MPTLDFKGKQFIYGHHLTVPIRTLEIDDEKSLTGEDEPSLDDNLIIHGDNLDALKALLPRYAGRVKCIYIDPPYNTGKDGWIYNDNVNSPLMQAWLEKNSPIDVEDMERHDKWLCMMWPRLHLLRELLAADGAIFISIDDNEQHRLRMLMDEIFGEEDFIASITWQKRGGPPNDKIVGSIHELIVIYGSESNLNLRPRNDGETSFSNPDNDPNGPWRLQQIHGNTRGGRWVDSLYYPIVNPLTGEEHLPPTNRNWVHNRERVAEMIASGEIVFGRDEKSAPQRKRYLRDVRPGLTWPTIWKTDKHSNFPTNRNGSAELTQIFGAPSEFDTPKPTGLIDRVLRVATGSDDIILDSFAGSGTTAHAALALNKEDGGNRKFILVECMDYADDITAERVRRVINGVENATDKALREGLGDTFTYCTLGDPIDEEGMLTGKELPAYETLASYIVATATGQALPEIVKQPDYFFGEIGDVRFYLIYEPTTEFLEGTESALDASRAEQIAEECQASGKKAYVYATHKFISQKELGGMNITFCQLPYNIYRITE